MRVSFITTIFPVPSETFVGTEVRMLRQRGVDVSVHALGPPKRPAATMLADWGLSDLNTTHGTASNVWRGILLCARRPALPWSLLRLIFSRTLKQPRHLAISLLLIPRAVHLFTVVERDRPDAVHLYWGHYPSLVGHLVLERLESQVLTSSLSAYDLGIRYGCSAPVATRAGAVRTWAAANVSTLEAQGIPSARIEVIYQGFDFERFDSQDLSAKLRRRIVSASRLIPAKRMEDVVETFRRILPRWPDASLVILGDGPERGKLEQLARRLGLEGSVEFRGHVSHQTVLHEMAAAELFLFMSCHPHERLPNVVKEAIAMRCLCVVTDTPGITELIRDGKDGFVVPQRDVEAAARRLQDVFGDEATAAEIKDSGYARLRERFSGIVVAEALEATWQSLVRKKRLLLS